MEQDINQIRELVKDLLSSKYNHIHYSNWSKKISHKSENFDPPWMCIQGSNPASGDYLDLNFGLTVRYGRSNPQKMWCHLFVMNAYFEDLFPLYKKKDEIFDVLQISRWVDFRNGQPEPFYGFTVYFNEHSLRRSTESYYSTDNRDPINYMLKGVGTLIEDRISFEEAMDPDFFSKIETIFNEVSKFGLSLPDY